MHHIQLPWDSFQNRNFSWIWSSFLRHCKKKEEIGFLRLVIVIQYIEACQSQYRNKGCLLLLNEDNTRTHTSGSGVTHFMSWLEFLDQILLTLLLITIKCADTRPVCQAFINAKLWNPLSFITLFKAFEASVKVFTNLLLYLQREKRFFFF